MLPHQSTHAINLMGNVLDNLQKRPADLLPNLGSSFINLDSNDLSPPWQMIPQKNLSTPHIKSRLCATAIYH